MDLHIGLAVRIVRIDEHSDHDGCRHQIALSRFAPNASVARFAPVTFPPGRLRLAIRPSFTASEPPAKTIGIVEVAAFAASVDTSPPIAAITATCDLTNSAAIAGQSIILTVRPAECEVHILPL